VVNKLCDWELTVVTFVRDEVCNDFHLRCGYILDRVGIMLDDWIGECLVQDGLHCARFGGLLLVLRLLTCLGGNKVDGA